jgi:hypothetical protein
MGESVRGIITTTVETTVDTTTTITTITTSTTRGKANMAHLPRTYNSMYNTRTYKGKAAITLPTPDPMGNQERIREVSGSSALIWQRSTILNPLRLIIFRSVFSYHIRSRVERQRLEIAPKHGCQTIASQAKL